jgi:type I restriction enzyme M protein
LEVPQGFGLRQPSGALRGPKPFQKRQRAGAVQDADALTPAELTFRVRVKAADGEQTITLKLAAKDNAAKKFKAAFGDRPEIISVEWTHRHYVQDDEYIPYGEDIAAFLKREIAKPIIRWEDSPQLGYEILPNKYFYRYQPPTPAEQLLAEFWKLEKDAEKMLEGLAK